MNAQESGAIALASIALQLTLLDTLVEKGLLTPNEVQTLLLKADAKVGETPTMNVTKDFLADLRRDLQL